MCSTKQLSGSLAASGAATGTAYYQLELRNVGSSRCYVEGYAGVSFVAGSNGHQVGAAAARSSAASIPEVVLSPGQVAFALLGVHDAYNFGSACNPTPVLGFRVYPPNQTTALYVPHSDEGCANASVDTLIVGPFASSPVS
jgi:hypothetical protein